MFQKTFTPAILAGICISIGCVVNLGRLYSSSGRLVDAVDGAFRQYYRLSAHGVAYCLCPARLCGACCQDPRRSSGERSLGMFPPGYRLRFHHDNGCRVRPQGEDAAIGVGCACVHPLWLCPLHCRCLLFPRFSCRRRTTTHRPRCLCQRGTW